MQYNVKVWVLSYYRGQPISDSLPGPMVNWKFIKMRIFRDIPIHVAWSEIWASIGIVYIARVVIVELPL